MTDIPRWKKLNVSWDARLKIMAKLISKGSNVLDIGCGLAKLKDFLPENCTYNTLNLSEADYNYDLNDMDDKDWSCIKNYSHIVCSGIMEYISNLQVFVSKITEKADFIIVSYAGVELNNDNREISGWENAYVINDIVIMFLNQSFDLIEIEEWAAQTILMFRKEKSNV